MNEERMRVLKMLENKKITAEQAAKLIDALESGRKSAPCCRKRMVIDGRGIILEKDGKKIVISGNGIEEE